ncbi:hypothetical protein ACTFIW_012117 [Dictyostelium discoideum]
MELKFLFLAFQSSSRFHKHESFLNIASRSATGVLQRLIVEHPKLFEQKDWGRSVSREASYTSQEIPVRSNSLDAGSGNSSLLSSRNFYPLCSSDSLFLLFS